MKEYRLLIVGASGLVGSNCLRYFREQKGFAVAGTHYSYATAETHFYDTLQPDNAQNYDVDSFAPTHILHAGALTHVDYCESHPDESYTQTVTSTKNMLALAEKHRAAFIYISTDYVFDGEDGPYTETDKVNPISTYGRHKLEAEELVRKSGLKYLILRITNVYGDEERNKNFVARLWQAASKREQLQLKLPIDQYATPINAADLARALFLLIKDAKQGTYHLAGTDYLNRVQLAGKVLRHFPEHTVSMEALSTSELNKAAPRPLQGGLKAHKFLSEYESFIFNSVDDYLYAKLTDKKLPLLDKLF